MFLSFGTLNHSVYSSRMMGTSTNTTHSKSLLLLNTGTLYLLPIDNIYMAINRTQDLSKNLYISTLDVQ